MMTFEWPWLFLALLLPLLMRWLPPIRTEIGAALYLPLCAELPTTADVPSPRNRSQYLLIAGLAWMLLVIAAARPQWLGEPVGLPIAGRDLLLALDISGSMAQEDYELNGRAVSRLAAVQAVATRFVERRNQDRLGLIVFGSQAYLQTPLTFDGATVATMLNDAVIGLAGRETAIGDAIALAIKRLREQPDGQRVLILLTDGQNTAGTLAPVDAAKLAAQAEVRIHTIGIGGGEVGIRTPFGMRLLRQGSDFDAATLKQIAEMTGGQFFTATNREQLEAVYSQLDQLEPNARDQRTFRPHRELFVWPAAGALLLSIGLALVTLGRQR
ncbi:BatB protein [Chromatium weissei]|nr:BatB protein [Chromatium weissei]